ncbi:H-NS histone family protein [Palleronia sp. LCG004]|uniref:H-NS histone family protein n=1 Tax=Palleronia sp. LCG004 TaxID=3079304 RepID=UPI0029439CF8|nr:H-NS histone family protein [Palleronia sp. LCG004]WOI56915.1 H-NS histone family protein [Palleronia sp. LCG004]
MDFDLDNMSREELEQLKKETEKALNTIDDRRRAEARAAAEKAARDHGFSLDDVMAMQKKSAGKSPAKYRNPEDPRMTWTGRGRQPGWIKEALDQGKSLEDFKI